MAVEIVERIDHFLSVLRKRREQRQQQEAQFAAALAEYAAASQPSSTQTSPLKPALHKPGSPKKPAINIQFVQEEPTMVEETFAAGDYERALDPGEDFRNLGELFRANSDLQFEEQVSELDAAIRHKRVRGFSVSRQRLEDAWGFAVKAVTSGAQPDLPEVTYGDLAVIDAISPHSPALKAGLKIGDRVVQINGDWVTSASQCKDLLRKTDEDDELDILLCRNEPLPEPIDFSSLSDETLRDMAFEHAGRRLWINPSNLEGFREQATAILKVRFQQKSVPGPEEESDA